MTEKSYSRQCPHCSHSHSMAYKYCPQTGQEMPTCSNFAQDG